MSMSLHDSRSELPDGAHFAVIDDLEEESDKAIQKDKSRRLVLFHQDEQAQIRPRSGELQGDSAMPDDFKAQRQEHRMAKGVT